MSFLLPYSRLECDDPCLYHSGSKGTESCPREISLAISPFHHFHSTILEAQMGLVEHLLMFLTGLDIEPLFSFSPQNGLLLLVCSPTDNRNRRQLIPERSNFNIYFRLVDMCNTLTRSNNPQSLHNSFILQTISIRYIYIYHSST